MFNIYLLIINLLAFLLYGLDKIKAIKHQYRISEKILLTVSFVGGSIGSLLGMNIFRHKINKPKFYILNPVFLIAQIYLYIMVL